MRRRRWQRSLLGSRWMRAVNTAPSAQSMRGRGLVRRSTATSCRSTRSSTSLADARNASRTSGRGRAPRRHSDRAGGPNAPEPRRPVMFDSDQGTKEYPAESPTMSSPTTASCSPFSASTYPDGSTRTPCYPSTRCPHRRTDLSRSGVASTAGAAIERTSRVPPVGCWSKLGAAGPVIMILSRHAESAHCPDREHPSLFG